MPRYYKYVCSKCGYELDEADRNCPLFRDINECPECGAPKRFFDEVDD